MRFIGHKIFIKTKFRVSAERLKLHYKRKCYSHDTPPRRMCDVKGNLHRPVNIVCEVEVMFCVRVGHQCAGCDVAGGEDLKKSSANRMMA